MALDGSLTLAATKAGNLASANPDSRGEVLGDSVQQCVDQPSFATVQVLQAVQPDIGPYPAPILPPCR